MIARIATFTSLIPETAAESQRNLLERFLPALKAQEGFVGGYWLRAEDGKQVSVTVWESEEALQRGAERANATPLLPGQDPSKIPSPDIVEQFEVVAIA